MNYHYLTLAIVAEVIATTALKRTDQFTRLWPSVIVAVGYFVAFYLLTLGLDRMSVGVVYAMWSGLEIVLVTIVAWFACRSALVITGPVAGTILV